MAENTNLKVDGLEFATIKDNFKLFLRSQSQFQDYNLEGSGISTIIDLLAYNTYYNSVYTNMVASEAFLATAQKRNSVVALASSLNYTPRSTSSATITGTLTLSPVGAPASIPVPQGIRFDFLLDGIAYNFVNREPFTVFRNGNAYTFENLVLTEGKLVNERYSYDILTPNQRFLINNANIDTATLQVRVTNSSSDTSTRVYVRAENSVALTSVSEIYYIEEVEDGKFEIFFGDNVIGKALSHGNIVNLDYIVSSGLIGNGIQSLTLNSAIDGVVDGTFTPYDQSVGGEDRESIERIKFNAPKAYSSQNRAVTSEDYAALVLREPNVGSVLVWGGEDNDPPAYGKVFLAIRPKVGEVLTATEKQNLIESVIKPRKVLTVSTEIVDPEYTYLELNVRVNYNPEQTILTESNIRQLIFTTIVKYNDEDLNQFSKFFRYSKLSRLVDTCERSIQSSTITVKMRKEIDVQLNSSARYVVNFSNPINDVTRGRPSFHPYGVQNQITSSEFSYGGFNRCFLEDNNGFIRVYRISGNDNVGVSQNVGTINYDTGEIVLTDFRPTALADGGVTLKIFATPKEKDVLPLRGQVIAIQNTDIDIILVNDKNISVVRR
jgi:hypothetical protein